MNPYEFIIRLKDQATSGIRQLADSVGVASNRARVLDRDMDRLNRRSRLLGSGFGALKGVIAGAFAAISVAAFTGSVVKARTEYERFQAVLTTTFQSSEVAGGAMSMLTEFAQKTPYELNELTGSFVKLVNRGFLPTYNQLTELGDLASSQGKSFDQLTEAILDAETAEFERLKEFGIKAAKAGDQITLSFKGTTKTVQNNSEALREAILEYGRMEGVAGSMDAVSKTIGGKIANLQDLWWNFLVEVGGQSSPIFDAVFNGLERGMEFLLYALPYVSQWFTLLWTALSPLVDKLGDFLAAAFSFGEAGSYIDSFGKVMSSVIWIVDLVATGLIWLLDVLELLAPTLAVIGGAWLALNALLAVTPIGWIIIGIISLIAIIGMLIKYTDGWGKSWEALKKMFQAVWNQIKADFNFGVEVFKYGFNRIVLMAEDAAQKIIGKFVNIGSAIEMALSGDFSGAWDKAFEAVETKASQQIKELDKSFAGSAKEYINETKKNQKDLKSAASDFGITFDTEGFHNGVKEIKDQFSSVGQTDSSSKPYDDYLGINGDKNGAAGKKDGSADKKGAANKTKDGIVSGGSRQTNIVVNIGTVGKDITIKVDSTEKGISKLGEKVREEMLRAVNSVNQMQTT